jgi:ferredoxin--NADP+ reductase
MPRVAIIGAGPSGLFAAAELLKQPDVLVDVVDALPTPFGLVRYGVAPDHPKIKTVTATLAKVFADPRATFLGNVDYGTHLTLADLRRLYDAVVFATGAPLARSLGIPGEDLAGSYAAADLVSWYNGHPDAGCAFSTSAASIAIIGAGNVSLDIARILLKGGRGLSGTDIPGHVSDMLDRSRMTDIRIIARRGVADVRFSPAVLLELERLDYTDLIVDSRDVILRQDQARYAEDRAVAQRVDIFRRWAGHAGHAAPRRLSFMFHRSPIEIGGSTRVESLRLRMNGHPPETARTEELNVQAVVRSIGYLGRQLAGIAFDPASGTVPNDGGRVVPGVYVTGWIKRGSSGVIGSNKACAAETVRNLLADLGNAPRQVRDGAGDALAALLERRGRRVVTWRGWTKIDAAEVALGREHGRTRTKICDPPRLVEIAAS